MNSPRSSISSVPQLVEVQASAGTTVKDSVQSEETTHKAKVGGNQEDFRDTQTRRRRGQDFSVQDKIRGEFRDDLWQIARQEKTGQEQTVRERFSRNVSAGKSRRGRTDIGGHGAAVFLKQNPSLSSCSGRWSCQRRNDGPGRVLVSHDSF